jgi:putative ABC transport system permease protein
MSLYLSFKEIWRNKGRFFLFSLVIALITVLVLFIAALAEGLATANKEYLEKMNADLLVFQENTDLSTTSSRLSRSRMNDLLRVPGVEEVGPVGFSNSKIIFDDGLETIDVALIGVESGKPGSPPVFVGDEIRSNRGNVVVLDETLAAEAGLNVGDQITIRSIQGTEEQYFTLEVVGITDSRQYFFLPSIFVPFRTWDQIKPQPAVGVGNENITNILAVRLQDGNNWESMAVNIQNQVEGVEAVDKKTAYEAAPGYQAQQSTLDTQRGFSLLIGVLVIGGFFQIQTLQKVPQIGVLKAIGTANRTVALAVILQIILVTVFGVILGTLVSLALAVGIPGNVPIIFTGSSVILAILSLLLIGPIGGIVSVRLALRVEPLRALGM